LMVNIRNGQWIMDNGLMITDGVMDGRWYGWRVMAGFFSLMALMIHYHNPNGLMVI
jgi:hypothetical protein